MFQLDVLISCHQILITDLYRDLYRGTIEFKKGYKSRINIAQDEIGDLVEDCHSILDRWRNYFSQLLNVTGFNDRQTEICTAESLVHEPSVFFFDMAIERLKRHCTQSVF
jgi:ABC-type Na+ transport system ATPase subunit NatA